MVTDAECKSQWRTLPSPCPEKRASPVGREGQGAGRIPPTAPVHRVTLHCQSSTVHTRMQPSRHAVAALDPSTLKARAVTPCSCATGRNRSLETGKTGHARGQGNDSSWEGPRSPPRRQPSAAHPPATGPPAGHSSGRPWWPRTPRLFCRRKKSRPPQHGVPLRLRACATSPAVGGRSSGSTAWGRGAPLHEVRPTTDCTRASPTVLSTGSSSQSRPHATRQPSPPATTTCEPSGTSKSPETSLRHLLQLADGLHGSHVARICTSRLLGVPATEDGPLAVRSQGREAHGDHRRPCRRSARRTPPGSRA